MRERIRLILTAGREAERPIIDKIPHWQSEAERLQADLMRQQMHGLSTRATSAAASVLIDVVNEEREAFRQSLIEPDPPQGIDEVEGACDEVLSALRGIEADADPTRERMLK
jgi:hypothetical protein